MTRRARISVLSGGGITGRAAVLAVVGAVVGAAALWIVARDLDVARTASIATAARVPLLVAALVVVAIQAVVRGVRWRLLLPHRDDGSRIPVSRVVPVMLVGYLGNALLPARLGEVIRGTLIARRERLSSAEAVGSVVLERVIDVLALALLGTLAATFVAAPDWMRGAATTGALIAAGALAAAAFVALAVRRVPDFTIPRLARIAELGRRFVAGARVLDRPTTILAAGGLTLVAWALDATIFWLVAQSLSLDLPPAGAMLVSAMAVLSTAVPTAPGYVGTFELAAVAGAGASGITGEPALAFAVLAHLVAIVPLSVGGAAAVWVIGRSSATTVPDTRGGGSSLP